MRIRGVRPLIGTIPPAAPFVADRDRLSRTSRQHAPLRINHEIAQELESAFHVISSDFTKPF
jgi:hypothetical protein